jgi:glutathione S-transferase
MNWQHLKLRANTSLWAFHAVMGKIIGKPTDPMIAETTTRMMPESLRQLSVLLTPTPFLQGDHYTAADILCCNEISQIVTAGFDLDQYPVVRDWWHVMVNIPEIKATQKFIEPMAAFIKMK